MWQAVSLDRQQVMAASARGAPSLYAGRASLSGASLKKLDA